MTGAGAEPVHGRGREHDTLERGGQTLKPEKTRERHEPEL